MLRIKRAPNGDSHCVVSKRHAWLWGMSCLWNYGMDVRFRAERQASQRDHMCWAKMLSHVTSQLYSQSEQPVLGSVLMRGVWVGCKIKGSILVECVFKKVYCWVDFTQTWARCMIRWFIWHSMYDSMIQVVLGKRVWQGGFVGMYDTVVLGRVHDEATMVLLECMN